MARVLLDTSDVYKNLKQLREMQTNWDEDHYLKFTDLFVPSLIAGTCLIIGKAVSKEHYKLVKKAVGAYITLAVYVDQFCSDLDNKALNTAVKTLEDNDGDGAIRFRTYTYLESDGVSITTSTLLSWNSNY